jgi:hypothetical protein
MSPIPKSKDSSTTGYIESVIDALAERTAQELIAALMIALTLSLILSGLYILGKRKTSDALALMSILTLLGCTVSMALAAGYVQLTLRGGQPSAGRVVDADHRDLPPTNPESFLAQRLFKESDLDGDGLISGEEAARAAELFVRQADPSGKGMIDRQTLRMVLRPYLRPPPGTFQSPPPPPGPPHGDEGDFLRAQENPRLSP